MFWWSTLCQKKSLSEFFFVCLFLVVLSEVYIYTAGHQMLAPIFCSYTMYFPTWWIRWHFGKNVRVHIQSKKHTVVSTISTWKIICIPKHLSAYLPAGSANSFALTFEKTNNAIYGNIFKIARAKNVGKNIRKALNNCLKSRFPAMDNRKTPDCWKYSKNWTFCF